MAEYVSRYDKFPYTGDSQLVGRVLRGAKIAEDTSILRLDTDQGEVVWDVEGDCCSSSLFTDIKLDAVLGKRIVTVAVVESIVDPALNPASLRKFAEPERDEHYNAKPLPDGVEESPQECEQIYGVRLVADDGAVGFVIHRNFSNAYYGGSLSERAPSSE